MALSVEGMRLNSDLMIYVAGEEERRERLVCSPHFTSAGSTVGKRLNKTEHNTAWRRDWW